MDLAGLLTTLIESLSAASASLPESKALDLPPGGISLLDTKNDIFLSYLQNVVFLIMIKLRGFRDPHVKQDQELLSAQVTKKLVELRIYLEKGVRPLEGKLQYQLDKLLQAATDADAANATGLIANTSAHKSSRKLLSNGASTKVHASSSEASDSHSDSDQEAERQPRNISDLTHRPNLSAFTRSNPDASNRRTTSRDQNGPYRPPRIQPTSLPTTDTGPSRKEKRPRKSHMLDDFVREEVDDTPYSQPSIGAGSRLRGKEREVEEERRGYEEQRLVRLPSGGKKEKNRKRRNEAMVGDGAVDLADGFGGVDGVDFKGAGTKRKKKSFDNGMGNLGARPGENWERRVQRGLGRKRR